MTTEILLAPDVDATEGDRLMRAMAGAAPARSPRASLLLSICCLLLGGLTAWSVFGAAEITTIIFLLGVTAALLTISAASLTSWKRDRADCAFRRDAAEEFEQARRRGRVIIVRTDLDLTAQRTLRTVRQAVKGVAVSRAYREGHLDGGLTLLRTQEWRIATALVQLSEARRILDRTGARLPEHRDAVRAAEKAVDRRIEAVLGYAESVRRVDAALADVDAASYTVALDHKIRDTLAALGEDQSMDALTTDSRDARTAIEAALEALRDRTDMLRSSTEREL